MPRRKPYSGKQKKAQLKLKREKKHHTEKLTGQFVNSTYVPHLVQLVFESGETHTYTVTAIKMIY